MIPQKPTNEPGNETLNAADPAIPSQRSEGAFLTIPLISEQLQVGKQVVETGRVTLTKTVHQHEQAVQIPLLQEEVVVERVIVDQLVDAAPAVRQEGDTTIYPVLKEEIVVLKRLRLVEEIRITRRQSEITDTQTVSLREEAITIERTALPSTERPG